jgi:hypothetical protein
MIAPEIVEQKERVHPFGIAKAESAVQMYTCALHGGAGTADGTDGTD